MKYWDVIIIGGGIIGLSLAISVRKKGLHVLLIERGEPGREASYAAAGMLSPGGAETPSALHEFSSYSASLYPEFVHELEDESGVRVDLREQGTILLCPADEFAGGLQPLSPDELRRLEPAIDIDHVAYARAGAYLLSERSLDPRLLVAAATRAAHHRQVDIVSGSEVRRVIVSSDRAAGVETERSSYAAAVIVNCAGAWAGTIEPCNFPVHPVKGQMLATVQGPEICHVVRSDKVYIVPRSDGRLVIGSTLENDGYNKTIDVGTMQTLLAAAVELFPGLGNSKKHDVWAGLRPGTPDELPILGETPIEGYFVATGHYRNGILLAPATAQIMTEILLNRVPQISVREFAASRFA